MDPLSITASIIAVLQLTSEVIKYLDDATHAPKERARLVTEASNLYSLLMNLKYRLDEGRSNELWYNEIKSLAVAGGPLDQYIAVLDELRCRVVISSGVGKIAHALAWKFNKAEVDRMLSRMERLKLLIQISLEMDHFKLSQAINEDSKDIKMTVHAIQQSQDRQNHQEIAEWISPTDFPAQQSDLIARREEGTGQWFLGSPEFANWLHRPKSTLFCPGIPGAGKTMLAAIAIDYLSQTQGSSDAGFAYVFCNYKSEVGVNTSHYLAALLKQLVQSRPTLNEQISSLHKQYTRRGTRPSLQEISVALQAVLKSFSAVYIVVDALDECPNKDGTRNQLLTMLRNLQREADLRLLVTSRFIPDIEAEFKLTPKLEIRASDADVKRFVKGQIRRLPNCIRRDAQLQTVVEEKIAEAVDGMFLLARLHVDSLLDKRTKAKVQATLEKPSRGSSSLDQAYEDALARMEAQLPEDSTLAKTVLSWITHAQRLLTVDEICHALAVERDDEELQLNNILDFDDAIAVCAGLVTVDVESNIVRLVHYTTQEYFEQIRDVWNPTAQQQITSTCLTYLSFRNFNDGSCSSDTDLEARLAQFPFLDYAARHWGDHAKSCEKQVSEQCRRFFQDDGFLSSAVQIMSIPEYWYDGYNQRYPERTTGLHLTARFGLIHLSKLWLLHFKSTVGKNADSKDSDGRTALSYAAERGHEVVVRLLVERDDVDVDSKGDNGRTPLSWAAKNGHEAVVKQLLATGKADVESKDVYGMTPLTNAARNGHEVVIELLLATGQIDVDSKDNKNWTPLSWAAACGNEVVVKLLLETGKFDVDPKGENGETPLSCAARNGYDAVVKLLLATGKVDVDAKDSLDRTPLSHAAENGHETMVELLLATRKININANDIYDRTPLLLAAGKGHEGVVKLLLETGNVDVNVDAKRMYDDAPPSPSQVAHSGLEGRVRGDDGRTALSCAARRGYESVVKLLLATGKVDVDAKDLYGRTALWWAAESGHEAIVELLLATGKADVDTKGKYDQTPLSRAAWRGCEGVVKLLLATDKVDIDAKNVHGRTPLCWAAGNGHEAIVKLLLATGKADVDATDMYGWTPLSWAARNGHEGMVKLLLGVGTVDIDATDRDGQTPLWWAAKNGHEGIVKLLLATGKVDVDTKGSFDQTALLCAAENGHEAVVKLLLVTGKVDVDTKDDCGQTPLLCAARNWHEAVVKLLLETGRSDVNSKDDYGRTPLSHACGSEHELDSEDEDEGEDEDNRTQLSYVVRSWSEAVVKLLLATRKVDIDSMDEEGLTALLRAAGNGYDGIVKLLVEAKADIDSKDNSGRTALSLATENGHEGIIKLLLKAKADLDSKDDSGQAALT